MKPQKSLLQKYLQLSPASEKALSSSSESSSSESSSESDTDSSSSSDSDGRRPVKKKAKTAAPEPQEVKHSDVNMANDGDGANHSDDAESSSSDSSSSSSDSDSEGEIETEPTKNAGPVTNGLITNGSESSATITRTSPEFQVVNPETLATDDTPNGTSKRNKKVNAPFSRIPKDQAVDPRFADNSYQSYDYAERAHQDLSVVKGKNFTKEKNKKKRGSYKGGSHRYDWR